MMSLFKELYHMNVNEHTKKVQGLTYLSWSYAWAEIKKIDEKASYEIHEFPMFTADWQVIEGVKVPYLKTPEGYFVKVSVTINGHTETETLPVMDNKNTPLGTIAPVWVKKDGAAKATKEFGQTPMPTSFDINTSHKRCLVKAIALHGLGLYIYNGEDVPEADPEAAKKEEEARLVLVKSIRDMQRQTRKTQSADMADSLDTFIQELQSKANKKIENMPYAFLQKAEQLVKIKLDDLTFSNKKEPVKGAK
jgi:hypothetical protein